LPVLIRERLIRDAAGVVCGMRSTMHDISDLARAEESLRAAEEKYRKIFENAIEGIFQIHPDGRYLDANPALASILGYSSPKELLGSVSDIATQVYVDPNRYSEFCAAMERDGAVSDFQSQVYREDGSVIWVSEHAMAVRDKKGTLLYYEGAMENMMARRQAEIAMASARDAAIESARLKTEFLANMSHEIRTPMNGIIGMTGLLLDTELSQRQRDFAETIADSSEALLKIINDVLDFSKIEAGMLTFEEIEFDLDDVLEGVVDLFSGRALSKGIDLSLIVEEEVPECLRGDPGRLRQVLANLVGNALKFTDRGEVRIGVRLAGDSPGGKLLRFEVIDTGIGISDEQQARLFQAFVQADGSTTRRYGGTGLGLAISKRIVSGMRGDIGVESSVGSGSLFWFTALFHGQARVAEGRERCFDGMRVLVMDDSATTRSVLRHAIEPWGAIVEEAADAEEALQLLSGSGAAGRPFHAALLDADVRCPGGESVVRAIRADSHMEGLRLVRVVSLNLCEEAEPEDGLAVDGQVTKPLKPREVRRCLRAVLDSSAPVATDVCAEATPAANPAGLSRGLSLRVLVAEDSMVSQKVVHFQLGKLGCVVESVVDGEAAVEAAKKGGYDVILMDCQMPRLDGFETTRRIRQWEANGTHRAWIIAMTAHSLVGDRDRCIEAGMDDYLSKPVRIADLAAALERCPARIPGGDEQKTEEPMWMTAVSRESLAGFRELEMESGRSILSGVIDLFIETTPPVFKEARLAIGRNDASRLARFAHNLKGSCSNFGARRMRDACERLESAAALGNLAAAEELLDEAEREFGMVRMALENELAEKAS
jgi:PAS domain S-box-containing protein